MHRGTTGAVVCAVFFAFSQAYSPVSRAGELPFSAATVVEGEYDGAISVETGDIDGDGALDIAAIAVSSTTLYWWRGGGDGSFTRLVVASSVDSGSDVEIVDVDGDGDADLLVSATGASDAIGWYENDGTPLDGGWTLRLIATSFDGAASVAVGDFDDDGDLDAVGAATNAGEIAVALNNGTGIPTYETVDDSLAEARWVAVGDVDKDGVDDVAAASRGASGEVAWYSRDAADTWTKHDIADLEEAASVELADVDRDGDLDALVAAADEAAIRWYENDGSGGGWDINGVGGAVDTVAAALAHDLDFDGDLDVLFGEYEGDEVAWWENAGLGDGSAWSLHTVDAAFTGPFDVAVGDADGDGDGDLFAVSPSLGDLAWWENLSIHRSAMYRDDLAAGAVDWSNDLEVVDVDGDGDLDFFVADRGNEVLAWSENDDGDATSWTVHEIEDSITVEALAAGDFNRDGILDVAGCTAAAISWWESDGVGGWTHHSVPSTELLCQALKAADFDRDGDLDLFKGSYGTGFEWYTNTDGVGGTWTETAAGGGATWDADSMAIADLDGDGDLDIAASTDTSFVWMENLIDSHGFINFEQVISGGLLISARSIAVGDIDGDGDQDLAGVLQTDDLVIWFENTAGDATAWGDQQTIVSGIDGPRNVKLADLDLDGDLDAVLVAESTESDCVLAWYENSAGDGSAWTPHPVSTETFRASALAVADLDRDGDPDLVHDSVDGFARWWPNRGGQAAFSTTSTAPTTLVSGVLDDVLEIVVEHRGIVADGNLEPAQLELAFTDETGVPLSQAESDALFFGVYVFEDDDDSGDFDPAFDSEVVNQVPPILTDGATTLTLPDGDSHLEVTPSVARTLFVAVGLVAGAPMASPNQFMVVHRTEGSSAEDRTYDTGLSIEDPVDVSSTAVTAEAPPAEIFADDFETGDTSEWSTTVGE